MSTHFRIPQLNGQYAVRALRGIPLNTIIGRFCGDEMYSFEYNDIYRNTCEYTIRNHYRMSTQCPDDPWSERKCPFEHKDNQIVLDELDPFPANPMVIMNDVRKNISDETLTDDDDIYWNAEYHHVYVNGWPFIYIVASKPILAGQEIASYYGPNYTL